MAIPKKGSRKIVVDDVVYRWRIRWKPSYAQECEDANLNAAAELYENPQSVLHIAFPWARYNEIFGTAVKPVTPKYIESVIKDALKSGWKPTDVKNFHVICEKS